MLKVEFVLRRTLLLLRCHMDDADVARKTLGLAPQGFVQPSARYESLGIAPDQWFLVSETVSAEDLLRESRSTLAGLRAHIVDQSAAHGCLGLSGGRVRELLAMGSGVNWSTSRILPGCCVRTRFAGLSAVIHCVADAGFDVYVDHSYRKYLEKWLQQSMTDPQIATPA
jgi:heterotetrameric sarcosine oxidase gamma subunit